jgi:tetratricopeptide (TPR) repeat protein
VFEGANESSNDVPSRRRILLTLLVVAVLGHAGTAFAQREPFQQMSGLLDQGYYNSAARLNGPDLIARFPTDPEAHYLYALALYLTDDLEGAAAELAEAVRLAGAEGPAYAHLRGMLQAANGDPAGALRTLENAFLRTREYSYAMDWGRVAWLAAQYDQALEAFTAAAGTPQGAREMWPHLDSGRLLMLQGRPAEAITAFETAIDVFERTDRGEVGPGSPAYVEAYYRLGEAYELLGDVSQAETHYRAARTADPNYAPAITALDRLSRSFD